jgi:hypothetical protein
MRRTETVLPTKLPKQQSSPAQLLGYALQELRGIVPNPRKQATYRYIVIMNPSILSISTRILTLIALIFMTTSCSTHTDQETAPPLRHVVLFKFKDDASPVQIKAIEEAFRALPAKIPGITQFEWGTDVSIEGKAQGFTHCFLVTFQDEAAREVYLPHPDHKAFVEILKPSLDKVTVVDFFATDSQGASYVDGKLRHVVLFQFKEGTSDETLQAIEAKFSSLPGDIPEIAAYEWGTNNSPEGLADGFTHCFLVTFDDEAGREIYLPHTSHKEFGSLVRPNVEKVLVFDFVSSD